MSCQPKIGTDSRTSMHSPSHRSEQTIIPRRPLEFIGKRTKINPAFIWKIIENRPRIHLKNERKLNLHIHRPKISKLRAANHNNGTKPIMPRKSRLIISLWPGRQKNPHHRSQGGNHNKHGCCDFWLGHDDVYSSACLGISKSSVVNDFMALRVLFANNSGRARKSFYSMRKEGRSNPPAFQKRQNINSNKSDRQYGRNQGWYHVALSVTWHQTGPVSFTINYSLLLLSKIARRPRISTPLSNP